MYIETLIFMAMNPLNISYDLYSSSIHYYHAEPYLYQISKFNNDLQLQDSYRAPWF